MLRIRRAALICRVSTSSQDNLRQVDELTKLAHDRGFLVEPDDIYQDSISGFSKYETRPALTKLLSNLRSGVKKYDMVFTWEISRISRDPDEGQKILLQFSEMGVPIYVKNISMCTHLEGEYDRFGKLKRNQMFGIVFTLLSEFAATEAEYIRERSISGLRLKKKNGHAGGGVFLPYGYTRDENKMLVVDQVEAMVVREIFEHAAKGCGLKTICHILNEAGVPTKSQKVVAKGTIVTKGSGNSKRVKKTDHIRWEEGTLQSILTNALYKGERKIKVDEKWENGKKVDIYGVVPAEPIVSPELFERVQKLRSDKFNKRVIEMRYLYLLKGLCTCGVCGRQYYARYKPGGTDAYYQCSSRRHKDQVCGNMGVNIEALESTVWNVVKYSNRLHGHLRSTEGNLKQSQDRVEVLKTDLSRLEENLADLEKERVRVRSLAQKGVYTDVEFDWEWERIGKQIKMLQAQIVRTTKQILSAQEQVQLFSNIQNYRALLSQVEKDRFKISEVLNALLDKVTVTSVVKKGNDYEYIVSIWFKSMVTPNTVLLKTTPRNHSRKHPFVHEPLQKYVGHDRFKYIDSSFDERIQYSEAGILLTPVQDVVDMITDYATDKEGLIIGSTDWQQFNNDGFVFSIDQGLSDCYSDIVLEDVPVLIPFEENNAIEKVAVVKQIQKTMKEAI
jgi:DNA invertase Pin-like site-specific DNA recombinase